MKFDLHMHSLYSDGKLSPTQVLEECKKAGLEIISLTDHENVEGIAEAREMGEKLDIKVIPGIEFATSFLEEEHHILGYFIDCQSPKLETFLNKWRKTKVAQIKKIVSNLQQFSFKISFDEIMAQARRSIDRPQISSAIFQNLEENLAVLKEYGTEDQKLFFKKFLLEKPLGEGLAFTERKKPAIQEVINLIQQVGGMAFWAHPFWKRYDDVSKIRKRAAAFQKFGLDGIETCYPFYNQEQTLILHQIARDLSMYESAGSDFHGHDGSPRQIGNFQTFGLKLKLPFRED